MASHSEVAHRWAQDDRNARRVTGFNMWFDWRGDTNIIYSYGTHFPVAAFMTAPSGRRVVLFTTRTYSQSTSKHISHVRRAIPDGVPVYYVERPLDTDHAGQLEGMLKAIGDSVTKAGRARVNGPWLLDQAARDLANARAFAADFGLTFPESASLDDLAERAKAAQAEAERIEAERTAKRREADKERFEAWQRGETGLHDCPQSYARDDHGFVYVRRDGDTLQTSLGVSVPWDDARRVFRIVERCKRSGEAWKADPNASGGLTVGGYRVESISASGNMQAGCHRFLWSRMEALAKAEGVL